MASQGFSVPRNQKEFAATLKTLVRDASMRSKLGEAGRKLALSRFSPLESFDLARTRQLFTLRVDITRLAVESVGLEAEIKGGKGYFRNSDTARRLREVAFLPVLTPSLIQLERELQRQSATDKILPGELDRAGVRE